ncbi:MAG: transposase [Candidatus Sericytochromatia bacterium]|nr:transposase [Candidatus Tanganyikabacteria bacterium]
MTETQQVEPTIWEVSNDLWALIEGVLDEHYPRKPWDFCRVDLRKVLNGVIFRMRSGCQWNQPCLSACPTQ